MDFLNQWLRDNQSAEAMASKARGYAYSYQKAKRIVCVDGLALSVQASDGHYSEPRENDAYPYSAFEIGYPSRRIEAFMPYAESEDRPTETIYAYVPIEIVVNVIMQHGGIDYEKAPRCLYKMVSVRSDLEWDYWGKQWRAPPMGTVFLYHQAVMLDEIVMQGNSSYPTSILRHTQYIDAANSRWWVAGLRIPIGEEDEQEP